LKQSIKSSLAFFDDTQHDIEDIFAKGDKVVLRVTFRAILKEDYMGVPTKGKIWEQSQIAIFRIENGKIVEMRGEGNELGTMMQLGMELKPKEGEK
jgi:predicted ester cyclase